MSIQGLTQRQIEILRSLIEEYINTAEAVGSETLEKKHNLSVSPATIRNEMVRLAQLGYLKKLHTSAGSVPTPLGMKFYVKELMKEKQLSVVEEVAVKEKLWDYREREGQFLRQLTRYLAEKTRALAIATTREGDLCAYGYANILEMPEFYDIDVTKSLLSAIEELDYVHSLCSQLKEAERIHVLIGDELGPKLPPSYGFVFAKYETNGHMHGEIGVFGPVRLNYDHIVPTVRFFGDLIEEIAKGW